MTSTIDVLLGSPGFDPEDLEAPRGHVLVFHGVGGIGKTTLSRTLEAALADAGYRPAQWGEPGWPADRNRPRRLARTRPHHRARRPHPHQRWCGTAGADR